MSPIPRTYAGWRHCIEVECGLPLTAEFVAARLAVLGRTEAEAEAEETARFRGRYGEEHYRRVLGWFRRAGQELAQAVSEPV